jgi:hypothetical protein
MICDTCKGCPCWAEQVSQDFCPGLEVFSSDACMKLMASSINVPRLDELDLNALMDIDGDEW